MSVQREQLEAHVAAEREEINRNKQEFDRLQTEALKERQVRLSAGYHLPQQCFKFVVVRR